MVKLWDCCITPMGQLHLFWVQRNILFRQLVFWPSRVMNFEIAGGPERCLPAIFSGLELSTPTPRNNCWQKCFNSRREDNAKRKSETNLKNGCLMFLWNICVVHLAVQLYPSMHYHLLLWYRPLCFTATLHCDNQYYTGVSSMGYQRHWFFV